jgi:exopolysaccharide production protein ExoZ
MLNNKKQLVLIQTFRGLAAILVLLFHVTSNFQKMMPHQTFLFSVFKFGFAGVDFFFVLSGFIICYSSYKVIQSGRYFKYIINRFIRIYPIYWVVFLFLLLPHILLPHFYNTSYPINWESVSSALLLLPNHEMINGVSWTLTFEVFFYLLFILIFSFRSLKLSFFMCSIYTLLIFVNLTSLKIHSLLLSPLILEFFLGIAIYFIFEKMVFKVNEIFLLILGVSMLIFSAMLVYKDYSILAPDLDRVLLFGVPAFFIILGAINLEIKKNIKIPTILLLIGNSSYSLYLIHLPIIVVSLSILLRLKIESTLLINILIIILSAVIVFFSILIFSIVEKPLAKGLKFVLNKKN